MINKTCSNGVCQYRFQGSNSVGFQCNYWGYCDYQRPKDSRKPQLTIEDLQEEKTGTETNQ